MLRWTSLNEQIMVSEFERTYEDKVFHTLSKVYALLLLQFGLFGVGMYTEAKIDSPVLALLGVAMAVSSVIIFYCSSNNTLRFIGLTIFSFFTGASADVVAERFALDIQDIVFVTASTLSIFTILTISSFFTRKLYMFYGLAAGLMCIIYLPIAIIGLFMYNFTLFSIILVVSCIGSMFILMFDTLTVLKAVEGGNDDVLSLATILFFDTADIFVELLKLVGVVKKHLKDDD